MSPDASLIREILARECDTVNHYEALAARATDEPTRTLILHLAKEEKEHIAECAIYLATLDEEYAQLLNRPLTHISETAVPSPARAPAAATPQPSVFTIGSLIARAQQKEKSR